MGKILFLNKQHTEIPIKVNGWVDEKIAPLVLALNKFDCVLTTDSCQGNKDKPAYVFFKYIGSPESEPIFFYHLGELLNRFATPKCDYEYKLQWYSGNTEPMAELLVLPEQIKVLADAVNSTTNSLHKSESVYGKLYRELRS